MVFNQTNYVLKDAETPYSDQELMGRGQVFNKYNKMTPRSVERARRREESDIFSMNGYKHQHTDETPHKL